MPLATGRDGRLHGRIWSGERADVRRVLLFVHGLGDHGGRFLEAASHFVDTGFAVAAIDLPGHGRSPGKRGHVDSYDGCLDDIDHFRTDVAREFPDVRQVIVGHSMGGNLALNYALRAGEFNRCRQPLDAIVLCAPILLPKDPPPRPQVLAAWLTGLTLRRLYFNKPVSVDKLTRDSARAQAIESDSLRHSRISLYVATQLLSQGRWAIDHARDCDIPTLILYGDDDSLIDTTACQNIALRMGDNATSISFAEMRHDLFEDVGREKVIQQMQTWLTNLLP
ncbi:MAG: lysophospholipase [Pirellulaceae bacterium]